MKLFMLADKVTVVSFREGEDWLAIDDRNRKFDDRYIASKVVAK